MPSAPDAAIVGLGITELGRVYGRSTTALAAEAVRLAAADAGLGLHDLDGLLVSPGMRKDLDVNLAGVLNLGHLGLLAQVNAYGSTAGAMITQAALAIDAGMATTVACVFGDTPLRPSRPAGSAWGSPSRSGTALTGLSGWQTASGATNPNILYAMCARRHMEAYGTTSTQLGGHRGRATLVGGGQPSRGHARPDVHRGPPGVEMDRRALSPPRLLSGQQRRRRGDRHVRRPRRRSASTRGARVGGSDRLIDRVRCTRARTGAWSHPPRDRVRTRCGWPASP
ncbi:hypothetical protein ACFOJ6_03725 [Gordonia humi]|uniref:hypothetical protein n=1 Tax=Gordonia humi TaxID=686429 RepID=UPI003610D1CC